MSDKDYAHFSVTELLASVGIVRQSCAGGAPTAGGGVAPEFRCNIARNGQAFNFDAMDAARLSHALRKIDPRADARSHRYFENVRVTGGRETMACRRQ